MRYCTNCGKGIGHIYLIGGCPFCGGELSTMDDEQAKKEGVESVFKTPLKDFLKSNEREFDQLRKVS